MADGKGKAGSEKELDDKKESGGVKGFVTKSLGVVMKFKLSPAHSKGQTEGPSYTPAPSKDVLANIHATIEEIKKEQKSWQEKKVYYNDRHGKQVSVEERMRKIVRSVESCVKIVDVAIQHRPEILALVWAGVRFILMMGCAQQD
ncbi:hypothetical protein EV426DRAFT_356957 [Tirmania nivea]|nr:hypothetical protein EV426DRAFT_356957 [Tirmania nivea]